MKIRKRMELTGVRGKEKEDRMEGHGKGEKG